MRVQFQIYNINLTLTRVSINFKLVLTRSSSSPSNTQLQFLSRSAMGCCQSEHPLANDFKSEIVTYEKKEENSNIFEDNFYLDSVERYNVKYKPPERRDPSNQSQSQSHYPNNQGASSSNGGAPGNGMSQSQKHNYQHHQGYTPAAGNNANINGGSGASGGQNIVK